MFKTDSERANFYSGLADFLLEDLDNCYGPKWTAQFLYDRGYSMEEIAYLGYDDYSEDELKGEI